MNNPRQLLEQNKQARQNNATNAHPQVVRSGKYQGKTFEEVLRSPECLSYIKFLLFGKLERSTKVFAEDRRAFESFFIKKATEAGCRPIATTSERMVKLLLPLYPDGFVFHFKQHKGHTLRQVYENDRGYVDWFIERGLQYDDNDAFWSTTDGIDIICIAHVLNSDML